jgi:hypothetical protein
MNGVCVLPLPSPPTPCAVNAGLKKVKMSMKTVLLYAFALWFGIVVYCAIVTGADPQVQRSYSTVAITGQYTYYRYCEAQHPATDYLLYAWEACLLMALTYLCYQVRLTATRGNHSIDWAGALNLHCLVSFLPPLQRRTAKCKGSTTSPAPS